MPGLSLTSTFRKFFTVSLCWILLITQLGVTASYAQDIEDVNITEHWREKQTRTHDTSVVNAIALLIGGFVAGSMLKCKRIPPSGKIFIAGMVVYLLGEITTISQLKERVRREIILYESTRALDASQRQALLSMVRSYNSYISAIKRRIGFLVGAFITLQIAAVLAFTEARAQEVTKQQALAASQQCFNGSPNEAAVNPVIAPQCLQCQQSAAEAIRALNNQPPEEQQEEQNQQDQQGQEQQGQVEDGQQTTDGIDQSANGGATPPQGVDTAPAVDAPPVEAPAVEAPAVNAPSAPSRNAPAPTGGGAFIYPSKQKIKQNSDKLNIVLQTPEVQNVMKLAASIYQLKPIEYEAKFAGPVSNLRLAPQ